MPNRSPATSSESDAFAWESVVSASLLSLIILGESENGTNRGNKRMNLNILQAINEYESTRFRLTPNLLVNGVHESTHQSPSSLPLPGAADRQIVKHLLPVVVQRLLVSGHSTLNSALHQKTPNYRSQEDERLLICVNFCLCMM